MLRLALSFLLWPCSEEAWTINYITQLVNLKELMVPDAYKRFLSLQEPFDEELIISGRLSSPTYARDERLGHFEAGFLATCVSMLQLL